MDFGGGVDTKQLSMLFFHAVTMQAILSGLISGYMRSGKLLSGLKYIIVLVTISLGVWMVVG
jgi:flagellar protein FlaJ